MCPIMKRTIIVFSTCGWGFLSILLAGEFGKRRHFEFLEVAGNLRRLLAFGGASPAPAPSQGKQRMFLGEKSVNVAILLLSPLLREVPGLWRTEAHKHNGEV